MTTPRMFRALAVLILAAGAACGGGGGGGDQEATDEKAPRKATADRAVDEIVAPEKLADLDLGEALLVADAGATNPTSAHDPQTGAVFMAWTREVPGETTAEGEDPRLEAVVARSDDGGETFGDPAVVSDPERSVYTRTVSPTQVQVGPEGTVYVLYQYSVPSELSGDRGERHMVVVRSDDGGDTWSAPVEVATSEAEGVTTSRDMATLFVAPDGDLYISYLDARENIAHQIKMKDQPEAEHSMHGGDDPDAPQNQLRVIRSADRAETWGESALVARATCVCCGTVVAKGGDGPVYAGTRSEWKELKDSKDAVRDPYLAASRDDGATWSKAVKIHDDKFKISGCPDVAQGLAVDSGGRIHAAWYTGSESHPGVYYATSDDQGKTFSAPLALLRDEWVPYGDVRLALDGKDHAWVAYEDRRGEVDKIRVVRLDPDGAASFSKAWEGTIPSISAGPDFATVVWQGVPGEEEGEDALTSVHAVVARPAG